MAATQIILSKSYAQGYSGFTSLLFPPQVFHAAVINNHHAFLNLFIASYIHEE
ncbi:hypothetical protein J5751_01905 [bacterium]|nr:hypothetical protein [bacterium]